MKSVTDGIHTFQQKHQRLKKYIHTAWRVPLPRWGQIGMGFVYFTVPIVAGYGVMKWAEEKSRLSIGEGGENLRVKNVEGVGNLTKIDGVSRKVGAGGVGMGVRLAVSDKDDQARNQIMLKSLLNRLEQGRGV